MRDILRTAPRLAIAPLAFAPLACTLATEDAATEDEASTSRTVEQAVTCATDPRSDVTIYIAPDGNDSNSGDCSAPFKTLAGAHTYIDSQAAHFNGESINTESYTLYMRDGVYDKENVTWEVASPSFPIRITAYPGEHPILDGRGEITNAFTLKVQRGQETDIEISHLTFRHYVQRAILLRGGYTTKTDRAAADQLWNGGNRILYNVFERIGDVYNNVCLELGRSRCLQTTKLSTENVICKDNSGTVYTGRAGVGGFNTRHNLIAGNVFAYIESADGKVWDQGSSRQVAHAFYVATFSHGNVVRNNYVTYSSGSAFKVRNRSDDNVFESNYITFSGSKAFIENIEDGADENPGIGNTVDSNVLLFGYPYRDSIRSRSTFVVEPYRANSSSSTYQFVERGSQFHEGHRPRIEQIGGMALDNVDDDDGAELFVAYNYPEFGISTIARTDSVGRGRYLNRLVFRSKDWKVKGLTIGEFEDGQPKQLISNLHQVQGGVNWTELWRGSGVDVVGAQDINRVYRNDNWIVTALAAGDFDDDGVDELLSAFKSDSGSRRVYRGHATGIGSYIWESTIWDVLAMTSLRAGQFSTRDTLYTSVKRSTGSGYEARLYSGNGVTSVTSGGYFESVSDRYFPSLAARDFHHIVAPRLYSAVAYNDLQASLFEYSASGTALGEIEVDDLGKLTHAVYGAVGNQSAAVITARELRIGSNFWTEIKDTNGIVFSSFLSSPRCNPDLWDCE